MTTSERNRHGARSAMGLVIAAAMMIMPGAVAPAAALPAIPVASVPDLAERGSTVHKVGYYRRRYYRPYYGGYYRPYRRHNGAAVAAGVIGLAAGALAGAAIANTPPRRTVIVEQPVYPYYPAPYTGEWYRLCAQKYRSFRASDGTYLGYDGYRHVCRIP